MLQSESELKTSLIEFSHGLIVPSFSLGLVPVVTHSFSCGLVTHSFCRGLVTPSFSKAMVDIVVVVVVGVVVPTDVGFISVTGGFVGVAPMVFGIVLVTIVPPFLMGAFAKRKFHFIEYFQVRLFVLHVNELYLTYWWIIMIQFFNI